MGVVATVSQEAEGEVEVAAPQMATGAGHQTVGEPAVWSKLKARPVFNVIQPVNLIIS